MGKGLKHSKFKSGVHQHGRIKPRSLNTLQTLANNLSKTARVKNYLGPGFALVHQTFVTSALQLQRPHLYRENCLNHWEPLQMSGDMAEPLMYS